MPDDQPRKRSQGEPEPKAGDAGLLFRDAPAAGGSSPLREAAAGAGPAASEVFDLADVPEPAAAPAPAPASPIKDQNPKAQTGKRREEVNPAKPQDDSNLDPSDLVQETWSRQSEWGLNLVIVGAWLVFFLLLLYIVTGQNLWGLAFFLLIIGGLVTAVLSYPILITLERPVRVTPEQAARDYFSALSHHVPHFRRMWLLLSTAGRVSSSFASFEGFKGYWKDRLGRLRQGRAGPLTPLVFEVINFKAEKSAGKIQIDATFSVNVSIRGQRLAGAIHTIPASISLVRGPDKMWYLENGTLPRGEPATQSKEGA
jgi:hypothetical protein